MSSGTGFNPDNLVLGAGNGQLEGVVLTLLQRGVQYDLAVNQTNANAGNRAVPRNIRNGNGNGGCQHSGDVRCTIRINCQNGHNYGNIVAHGFWKQRTNRTINHTRGQNRLFRGLPLPLGKGTGDSPY